MTRQILIGAVVLLASAEALSAQPAGTDAILDRIREEGLERSEIMNVVHVLTDRYGPRLTGSPTLDEAGEWVLSYLSGIGLENAHKEGWDWGHPGWENDRLSAHIVSPISEPLVGEVLAWTSGTNGPVTAPVLRLIPPDEPTAESLDAFLGAAAAAVRGAAVLVGEAGLPGSVSFDRPQRRDDSQVAEQYQPDAGQDAARARPTQAPTAQAPQAVNTLTSREVDERIGAFLLENGASVRINPAGMVDGLVRAFSSRSYDMATSVPTVILRNEDFGRLARLSADGLDLRVEFDIVNRVFPEGATSYNYVAEIPGAEAPEEVVIIGGHLDSWHAATGATDNATGSAVMIEAVRILKALDLEPRRTIRLALWSGEEQGLLGSQAYVEAHFGTYESPKVEFNRFGGYINVDSGTGRLRGASVFGPREAAEMLHAMAVPLNDLGMAGARATSSRRLGGSDYTSFNQAGLPGISMGQDPIRYNSHTWHTNLDTYEQVLEDDVKQAAVVVASIAWQLAVHDRLLPRFVDAEMPRLNVGTE